MTKKKNILLVGENPYGHSGNSHMMLGILKQIDMTRYNPCCFVKAYNDNTPWDLFDRLPVPVIPSDVETDDPFGAQKLYEYIINAEIHAIIFVGLDIWAYRSAYKAIRNVCDKRNIKWISIFPYDLQEYREDWGEWIRYPDYACVYSEYGYNILKDKIPNIRYFRPSYYLKDKMKPFSKEDKLAARHELLPTLRDDQILFGFIGNNQLRKCPDDHIKAFIKAKHQVNNISMYIHSKIDGEINIIQTLNDCGFQENWVHLCQQEVPFSNNEMIKIINTFDCLLMCSMQEGLSWTPLEAMLCGVPVIASNSTAHPELIGDAGLLVSCETPSKLPLPVKKGRSWIDTKKCDPLNISMAIIEMAKSANLRTLLSEKSIITANNWIKGESNINDLMEDALSYEKIEVSSQKNQAVLFAQHSAAGDVFMTTRCFKGIKERFPDMPLVYMTSDKYMGVVEGNPYLDEIIPWDKDLLNEYEIVLNPHGDKILPGHWGRNSNSLLSDFYWKILDVEPDDFYIKKVRPHDRGYTIDSDKIEDLTVNIFNLPEYFVVVHTTGGDPEFRTYKYMKDVCNGIDDLITIQVGGENDYPAGADIDLRGDLTYQEVAWVMDKASLAITVDSFISHLAGALGISQVCLFGSGNANVVRPNQVNGELICLIPDYVKRCPGLGPCSASMRDCPFPCTGRHNPKSILEAIEQIKSHGNIRRNYEHETACVDFKYA